MYIGHYCSPEQNMKDNSKRELVTQ